MSKKEGNFTFLGSLFEIVKIVPYDQQEMTHNNREEFYKKFGGVKNFPDDNIMYPSGICF